jgi:hypothetical protein
MGDHWEPYSLCSGGAHLTQPEECAPCTPQIGRLACWEAGGTHTGHGSWMETNTAHAMSPAALW